jgi:transposase
MGNRTGSEKAWEDRYNRMLYRWYFCKCQKRGLDIGKTKKGKGTKIMAITDASGIPLSIWTTGASTHEIKLVEQTIEERFIREKPKNIIGDQAYDSDPLDKKLRKKKINLIAPHKRNRKKMKTQDGRILRRYCRRWKIERFFAWLQNYRRCVVRYEYNAVNYLGFVKIACVLIMTKHF